jgi:hypothetical protein
MDTINKRGVVFADNQHRTIFADSGLQNLLLISKESLADLIGEPVHKLFGISSEIYKEIVKEPQKVQQSKIDSLELRDKSGNSVLVNLNYTVSKDAKGKLMGIDFTVYQAMNIPTANASVATIPDEMIEEVIRFYFKRQVESLHEVMTQIGGRGLWQYIETAINTTAAENDWAIVVNGKDIVLKTATLPLDAYRGLLFKAASYAVSAIGKNLVKKRFDKVDEQSNPIIFEHIPKDWFDHLS